MHTNLIKRRRTKKKRNLQTVAGQYIAKLYLFKFIGLGLVFVAVSIFPVGHAEPPHRQDTVHIVSDPGILQLGAGWQKACHWILVGAASK